MTSVNPVQPAGAALIVAVVAAVIAVEVTWAWATRTGLTTSVVTASRSSERSWAS